MDSYIVRVYRRLNADSRSLLGVIENVDQQEKHVFRSLDELWEVLNSGRVLRRSVAQERDLNSLLKGLLDGAPLVEPSNHKQSSSRAKKTKASGNVSEKIK